MTDFENMSQAALPDYDDRTHDLSGFDLEDPEAWLADPEHAAEMAESAEDIRQSRTLSLDEVRAQLAARR